MADEVTSIVTTKAGSYRITHPRDATDDQIRAYTADYLKKMEPETNFPAAEITRPKPESFMQGFLEGVEKPANNLARLAETGLDKIGLAAPIQAIGTAIGMAPTVNDAVATQQQQIDNSPVQGSPAGRIAGEIIGTAPTMALPGGVLAQGAASGALLTDERTPMGVLKDASVGAVTGKLADVGLRGAAHALDPDLSTGARTLLNEGVELTPGQMIGGVAKSTEDFAAKLPWVGNKIATAQRRAQTTLNRAQINRSLRPIGEALPRTNAATGAPLAEAGHEAVAYAGDRLRAAYSDVLPRLSGNLDRTFETRINTIRAGLDLPPAMPGMPNYDAMLNQAESELGNAFTRAGRNGQFNGRTLRDTSERLEDLASAWRKSDDPYIRRVGQATEDMRQQLHALARRQNPADAQRLRNIDRGYASLVRTEKAAAGTADGVFTESGLNSAVRMTDRSARRRAVSRGEALDQGLSSAAMDVMQNRASQGGSKDVNTALGLFALGHGALNGDAAALAGVAGIAGGGLTYTQPVLSVARTVLGRNPTGPASAVTDPLARLLRIGATGIGPTSAALADQP